MMSLVKSAHDILHEAISEYKPSGVYALFSGGYDSLCCTHVTAQLPQFQGVVHINTGIGIEETRQFVRDTCKAYGWPLLEYRSPISYEETILKEGFPGPACHRYMYVKLKERALDQFIREHKMHRSDRVVLSAGVRKQESQRRMGTAQKIRREGASVWVNPLFDWAKSDVLDYKEAHHLPSNEVVDLLHMSGECLCGAFAKRGELKMIEAFYPATAQHIHDLEERVHAAGFPWGWEEGRPEWFEQLEYQEYLPGFAPLCSSCDARHVEEERRVSA